MRARIIDAALLLGLVAVAAGIMWTLFNLGASPRGPTAPPAPAATAPDDAPGLVPIVPGAGGGPGAAQPDDAAQPGAAAPPGDDAAAPDAAAGPDAPAPTDPAGAEPEAAAPPPAPRVVPEGAVELERLGFSFVTGGPGACGMVLEPWQHVAVSRELLDAYGCGARVRVTLDDEVAGRTTFDAVVGDTMPPQIERTLNVYVGADEPAFQYGVTTGTVIPLE